MLCSARDLGLSEDHSGLLELDEYVMTLSSRPRADCLSILGVAREVAALTGAKLVIPEIKKIAAKSKTAHLVKISDPEGCGRFAGA